MQTAVLNAAVGKALAVVSTIKKECKGKEEADRVLALAINLIALEPDWTKTSLEADES